MIEETVAAETARRFYDRIGRRHDWSRIYEAKARSTALHLLQVGPGQRVLEIGAGTGVDLARLCDRVGSESMAVGIDISTVMLRVAASRSGAHLAQADARRLPFASGRFDRVFCAYVLDLLPARELPRVLAEVRRVLVPGGRVAAVSLTTGVSAASRLLVGAWTRLYRVSPVACGGCRPLPLESVVQASGLAVEHAEVVVQWAVPSAVVVARRSPPEPDVQA